MSKEKIREFIRSEFTDELKKTCNLKSRQCRGGSKDLYSLLVLSEKTPKVLDISKLQIISGLGHTFIRYEDSPGDFIYIDPTIGQFDPDFDGIFIGDKYDLYAIVKKQLNKKGYKLNITNYIRKIDVVKDINDIKAKLDFEIPIPTYPLPNLTIETRMMGLAKKYSGGKTLSRKVRKTRKIKKSRKRLYSHH